MTPFTIVILICSMAIDHAACQPETAIDVVQGPKANDASSCNLLGQATIASTAIAPRAGEEYMKIVCTNHGDALQYHSRAIAISAPTQN